MSTILDRILATKRGEIAAARAVQSAAQLRRAVEATPPARDFAAAVAGAGPIKLIAEIKKASPSRGIIREDFQPLEIARAYAASGASCLSVLTDAEYFQGCLAYLEGVRAEVELPVLRKDFLIDPYQLLEARAAGADAVLLIAECLDERQLAALLRESRDLGMTALVEFYQAENLPRVLDCGATLIGVNNRDLRTFQVDLDHSIRMRARIPSEIPVVAESGIHCREEVVRLEQAGVNAMLVGESLMAQPDVGAAVRRLLGR